MTLAGRNRGAIDPRVVLSAALRKLQWETGKFGCITKSVGLLRCKPDHEKQIRSCVKKWKHRRTTGKLQWPEVGTFTAAFCNEVEASIKHYKAKDMCSSREGKRAGERVVLRWFRQEGHRQILDVTQMPSIIQEESVGPPSGTVGPHPPPYSPPLAPDIAQQQVTQCPVRGTAEGELAGRITVTWKTQQPEGSMIDDKESVDEESSLGRDEDKDSIRTNSDTQQSRRSQQPNTTSGRGGHDRPDSKTSLASRRRQYDEADKEGRARETEKRL